MTHSGAARRRRGFGAALAAIAVAALGVIAVPSSALADTSLPENTPGVGSITVTKLATPAAEDPGDGTQLGELPSAPINDVEFTLYQVPGIALDTQAGWTAANALVAGFNTAKQPPDSNAGVLAWLESLQAGIQPSSTQTSGSAGPGVALFDDLDIGLYVVMESDTPPGVTPSVPFIISVPMTRPDGEAWMYDVFAYPKNSVDTITKAVDDTAGNGAVGPGDDVTWTLTASIPDDTGDGYPITGYQITDTLPAQLGLSSVTVKLSDGTALTAGIDFTLTAPPEGASGAVKILFDSARQPGLDTLTANRDKQLVVTLTTKVLSSQPYHQITNQAVLFPSEDAIDSGEEGGVPSNQVSTKWGKVTVLKVGTDTDGEGLDGAVFRIYRSKAEASENDPAKALKWPGGNANGDLTTTDGVLDIPEPGLRYSDFADGVQLESAADPGYQTYWLVEVKAPPGYELQAEPQSFTVTEATAAVGVDLTVTNVPANAGFTLPFTGGPGWTLAWLVAAVLAVSAALLGLRGRRRREAA